VVAIHDREAPAAALIQPGSARLCGHGDPADLRRGGALIPRFTSISLLRGIACNHTFEDGNKRTALLATYTFYGINGYTLEAGDADGRALLTLDRTKITELLREVSGEPTTRIKLVLTSDLTSALVNQGVLVYPSLGATTTGDTVRLYHAGSVFGQLVDVIVHPDQGTDKDLGDILTKIKGKWQWAPVEGPATSAGNPQPAHLVEVAR
jgi:hypothetical protein